jgi:hypothetical protein
MPPHLDINLSNTASHGSMMLSPRLNMRRASSYTNLEKAPMSSTSSRFSFNHLISSPPPSPGLPALVPRHGKPAPPKASPRRCARLALWLSGVLVILYYGFSLVQSFAVPSVGWATDSSTTYEMIGEDALPDYPTPVIIMDKRGRAKWTVSIPPTYDFPLSPKEYSDICTTTEEVSDHVNDLHHHAHVNQAAHYSYYKVDQNFMDVWEAQEAGLLPSVDSLPSSMKDEDGSVVGEPKDELVIGEVCRKSMTFVLESNDAGLGATLLALWTSYGLAQKEGRAFFIDDSRWYA